nr:uncharacterized protein LOC131772206 [Pocillopora verrucosa]
MMTLTRKPTQTICLGMLVFVISGTWGYRSGLEVINVTFCGKYDKPPTFKASPWPFFPAGVHYNLNVTFASAVDVLEASMQYEVVYNGKVIFWRRLDSVCHAFPYLCSLPAGETIVLAASGEVPVIPRFLKNRICKFKIQLFNGEDIMFLCAEIEGKVW